MRKIDKSDQNRILSILRVPPAIKNYVIETIPFIAVDRGGSEIPTKPKNISSSSVDSEFAIANTLNPCCII